MTSKNESEKDDNEQVAGTDSTQQKLEHLDSKSALEKNRMTSLQPEHTRQAHVTEDDARANSHEAGLRHIIRLQRQALSRQNLRIQQQRTTITRLNQALRDSNNLNEEQPSAQQDSNSWLRSLLRSKNG